MTSKVPRELVPGRELSAAFYSEVIKPAVSDIAHAAALLGWGSDVLGYDTERSTDHGWGPRLQLFVDADDVHDVKDLVAHSLPDTFRGWPTRFGWDDISARDWVEVTTLDDWVTARLGFVPKQPLATLDWVLLPQQRILEITSGPVFYDAPGDLGALRALLSWYPDQVWLWLLACQWQRIAQEEAFVGRTAEVGDELGSRIVAARLARDLMRLCFLLERRYAPYTKWLGTAFATLDAADEVGPALERALAAPDCHGRERASLRPTKPSPTGTTSLVSLRPSIPPPAPITAVRSRSSTPNASWPPARNRSMTLTSERCRHSARSTSSSTPPTSSAPAIDHVDYGHSSKNLRSPGIQSSREWRIARSISARTAGSVIFSPAVSRR